MKPLVRGLLVISAALLSGPVLLAAPASAAPTSAVQSSPVRTAPARVITAPMTLDCTSTGAVRLVPSDGTIIT